MSYEHTTEMLVEVEIQKQYLLRMMRGVLRTVLTKPVIKEIGGSPYVCPVTGQVQASFFLSAEALASSQTRPDITLSTTDFNSYTLYEFTPGGGMCETPNIPFGSLPRELFTAIGKHILHTDCCH